MSETKALLTSGAIAAGASAAFSAAMCIAISSRLTRFGAALNAATLSAAMADAETSLMTVPRTILHATEVFLAMNKTKALFASSSSATSNCTGFADSPSSLRLYGRPSLCRSLWQDTIIM